MNRMRKWDTLVIHLAIHVEGARDVLTTMARVISADVSQRRLTRGLSEETYWHLVITHVIVLNWHLIERLSHEERCRNLTLRQTFSSS